MVVDQSTLIIVGCAFIIVDFGVNLCVEYIGSKFPGNNGFCSDHNKIKEKHEKVEKKVENIMNDVFEAVGLSKPQKITVNDDIEYTESFRVSKCKECGKEYNEYPMPWDINIYPNISICEDCVQKSITRREEEEKRKFKEAKKEFALDCYECGICSYVCPSKIPLVHWIKYAKQGIMKNG